MKAKIEINFEKIADIGNYVFTPKLKISTEKTIKKLCEQIEKYFNKYKIKTKIEYHVEDGD